MNQKTLNLEQLFIRWHWAFFVFVCILMLFARAYRPFDMDEIEGLHTAWNIAQGNVIYRDFFQHHHPFLYYCLALIIKLFGETLYSIIAARIFIVCIYILSAIAVYLISTLICTQLSSIIALYFFLYAAVDFKILEIRPDSAQTLLSLISLFFWFRFTQNKTYGNLAWSAFFLALSFLFLQKTIFLMALLGLIMLYELYVNRITIYALSGYLIIFCATIFPYYAYLLYNGLFELYFKLNWVFNILLPGSMSAQASMKMILANTLLTVFFGLAIFFYAKSKEQKQLIFISLGLLLTALFCVKFAFPEYFAPAVSCMIILASYALDRVLQSDTKKIAVVIVLLSSYQILSNSLLLVQVFKKTIDNEQLKKIQYVLDNTQPDEYVFDGQNTFNIFRKSIDYLWFLQGNPDMPSAAQVIKNLIGHHYDKYKAIEQKKPRIIAAGSIDMQQRYIKENYVPSSIFNDILLLKSDE